MQMMNNAVYSPAVAATVIYTAELQFCGMLTLEVDC